MTGEMSNRHRKMIEFINRDSGDFKSLRIANTQYKNLRNMYIGALIKENFYLNKIAMLEKRLLLLEHKTNKRVFRSLRVYANRVKK